MFCPARSSSTPPKRELDSFLKTYVLVLLLRPDDGEGEFLSMGTILIGLISFLPVCKERLNSATASLPLFLLSLEALPKGEVGL